MKNILLGLTGLVVIAVMALIVTSCSNENPVINPPANPHVANASCGNCHTIQQSQWADPLDLHSLSAANVLTNVGHNTAELLTDGCLKCHSTFQYPLGIGHFVTPVNQTGPWTALNTGDWKATNCEVCHDPYATNPKKLAKYGSILDGQWSAGYTNVSVLPDAYQKVISLSTGDTSTFVYANQTTTNVLATKLCNSCHDPADQGSDPEITVNGINIGPQGGDSRAYVAINHQGFSCIDCHNSHNFMPVNPQITAPCYGCHTVNQTGKVHLNHWE